jgi:ribose-phosphate pyrophosphokinase
MGQIVRAFVLPGLRAEGGRLVNRMMVFTGSANPELARQACSYLGVELGNVDIRRFKDGEISVKINNNVRGTDVFVFQPTCPPAENLMELLIMLDAVKRASALRATAVIPYFGYARQDRKDQPRVAISSKLVANLITVAGADRVLTMDLHAPQIQGFFDIPFDHLYSAPVILEHVKARNWRNLCILSPDLGSAKLGRAFAKRLGADLAVADKRRPSPDRAEVLRIIGEIAGKTILILDDMISTGTTVVEAAEEALKLGARAVYACATHGVFAPDAIARLDASPIAEFVVTDTIPHQNLTDKFTELSVAALLGEAIRRIHEERSLSSLFV